MSVKRRLSLGFFHGLGPLSEPSWAALTRMALGAYLIIHFALLLPYAVELFSSVGILPDARLSPLTRVFPNVLAVWDAPVFVWALLSAALAASFALTAGVRPRASALFVAYTWACLLGRNPLIRNPSLPFVGLMLVTLALEPAGDEAEAEAVRARIRGAFLWVLAAAYTYSGYTKLGSPSWVEGRAFGALLLNPLARDHTLRAFLLSLPEVFHHVANYGVLGLELVYLPLSLAYPRLRGPLSAAMVCMHLGLLVLVDFADLSGAMLLAHLFTWRAAWGARLGGRTLRGVRPRGTCGGVENVA